MVLRLITKLVHEGITKERAEHLVSLLGSVGQFEAAFVQSNQAELTRLLQNTDATRHEITIIVQARALLSLENRLRQMRTKETDAMSIVGPNPYLVNQCQLY